MENKINITNKMKFSNKNWENLYIPVENGIVISKLLIK